MSESAPPPLLRSLRWLTAHAGFPASRLPARAELLVLIAAAAHEEPPPAGSPRHKIAANPNFAAQIRNYTAQRRRVHLTVDNSAKT